MINTFFVENPTGKTVKNFAYRDEFIRHGAVAELQKEYGVNIEEIEAYLRSVLV